MAHGSLPPLFHEGLCWDKVHATPPCPQMSLTAFVEVPSTHRADQEHRGPASSCSVHNSEIITKKKPTYHVVPPTFFLTVDFHLYFFMLWQRMKIIFEFQFAFHSMSFPFPIRKGRGIILVSDGAVAGPRCSRGGKLASRPVSDHEPWLRRGHTSGTGSPTLPAHTFLAMETFLTFA